MKRKKLLSTLMALFMILTNVLNPQLIQTIFADSDEPDTEDVEEKEDDEDVEVHDLNDNENLDGDDDVEQTNPESDDDGNQEDNESDDADDKGTEDEEEKDNKDPPAETEGKEKTQRSLQLFSDRDPIEITENLITGFELVLNPGPNEEVIDKESEAIEIDLDEINALKLTYKLHRLEDLIVTDGDKYTIHLPEIFKQEVSNQPIEYEGTVIGEYSIIENQLVITFKEAINELDQVDMNLTVTGEFNKEIFETKEEVEVEVPYKGEDKFSVIVKPKKDNYTGEDKKIAGKPYVIEDGEKKETDKNPEYIDWTIRVNDEMNVYEKATIVDALGDYLEIDKDSFKIERIIRNYKNEEIGREPVNGVIPEINEAGFEIQLDDISHAYDITYTTKVTRPEGGGEHTIYNNAKITLDGTDKNIEDSFTGNWSGDIPMLQKSGEISKKNADKISWEVEYNFGQEKLGEVTLTDILTQGKVDLDSVNIYEVDVDIDGNHSNPREVTGINSMLDAYDNLIIPDLDADGKAYLIEFQSNVPLGLKETITNKVEDNHGNEDDASVEVDTIPTSGKVGEQKVDEDGHPFIEWTITLNSKKVNVPSINITDVFDSTLLRFDTNDSDLYSLTKDNIEVSEGYTVEPYTHDDGRKGFTLNIPKAGASEYKFIYRTYYTEAGLNEPELANHAEFVFGNSDGDDIVGEPVDVTQDGPKVGIQKSGKYVVADNGTDQEIEWTITFNKSKILLNAGSKLTDVFSSENYKYIEGSLTVEGITEEKYTFEENDDKKGFELILDEATKETITVKFRTTTDDENQENEEHTNNGTLDWQGGEEPYEAKVAKRLLGSNKYGEVIINDDGSKTVNWTINFNTNRNVIHNFELIDTNTPDTVTIKDIKITSGGEDTTTDFDISSPEDGKFTVKRDRLDPVQYQLTYSTTLSPEEEKNDLKNSAEISYTGGAENPKNTIPKPGLGVDKKAVGYVDKTDNGDFINWKIIANTDSDNKLVNLVNPILTDIIPTDQELVKGTIDVKRVGAESFELDNNDITEYDNEFEIKLPDGAFQYEVTFRTKVIEYPSMTLNQPDRYTNETTLSNAGYDDVTDDAYIDYFADGTNNELEKEGLVNEDTEDIDWTAVLNPAGLTINKAFIKDTLSNNQHYILDKDGNVDITIEGTDGTIYEQGEDKDYTITMGEDELSFIIEFLNPLTQKIEAKYSTRVNPELIGNIEVTNNIALYGRDLDTKIREVQKETTTSQWFYGGGGSGKTLAYNLIKEDPNGNPISEVEFEFVRITPTGQEVDPTLWDKKQTTSAEGKIKIENARAGRYKITETDTPEGYQKLSEPIYIIAGYSEVEGEYVVNVTDSNWNILEDGNDVAKSFENNLTITNSYTPGKTSIQVTKEWLGEMGDEIKVKLLAGGVETGDTLTLNENNNWTAMFTNLDKKSNGEDVDYSVEEVEIDGYDSTITGDTSEGFVITNTRSGITEVSVEKIWQGTEKDSVTIQLFAEDKEKETIELTAENNWKHTFTELPEFDEEGLPIEYSIEEVEIEGYISEVTGNHEEGFKVTNTRSGEISIDVTKTWKDEGDTDRPESIEVELFRSVEGGEKESVDSYEVTAASDWTLTIDELPGFDDNGKAYTYEVEEIKVDGYEAEINGLDITNTRVDEKSIEITKSWLDDDTKSRPESIEVELFRSIKDGEKEKVNTYTLTAKDEWKLITEKLPSFDENGKAYTYEISETPVKEYNTEITGDAATGFVITNTQKTYAIGDYTWIDENKDGIQDDDELVLPGVKVELYDETGEKIAETTTSEDGLYIFDELEAGNYKVKFILTEEQAELYEFTKLTKDNAETDSNANPVAGDDYGWTVDIELNEDNEFLTKSYEDQEFNATEGVDPTWDAGVILREKIDVSGSKTWDDSENQDGKRPESITINLLADGEEIASKEVTAEDDNWSWTFEDLYKSEAGSNEDIVYTITEEAVEDYSTVIKGNDYNVTNSYTPGKTSVQITKAWVGEKGKSVDVKLLADGKDTGEVLTLTADNNWTGTFINLDEYKAGKLIKYTVEEVEIDEYNTEITGDAATSFVITNTQKTYAIGDYVWIDTNKDGKQDLDEERLPGVKVELFDEDGKKIAETTTDKNGRYIFDELPAGKYKVKFTLTKEQAKKYEFTQQHAGKDDAVDSNADPKTGWTIDIVLNDENSYLTKDYTDQDFKATEGIDPTWDAGVILKDIPEDPKDSEKPEEPSKPEESDKESKDDSNLPKTGETTFVWLAISLILIGLGLAFVKEARKEE